MRIIPNSSGSNENRQAGVYPLTPLCGKQEGFTLLEVMIVIVIIGIMTGIAVPAFSEWRERQAVRSASQALMAHLKQARVLAVSENRNVSFSFTATSYTFDADATGSCGPCKNTQINLSQFSGNLAFNPVPSGRTFSSRGTVNFGSMVLVSGAANKTITLNLIGRAYFQ